MLSIQDQELAEAALSVFFILSRICSNDKMATGGVLLGYNIYPILAAVVVAAPTAPTGFFAKNNMLAVPATPEAAAFTAFQYFPDSRSLCSFITLLFN